MRWKMTKVYCGMISRDPIVQSKILGTLQPEVVLLFETEKARKNQWEKRIITSVEYYVGYCTPPPKVDIFKIDEGTPIRFAEELASRVAQAAGEGKELYFDVTSGKGLLRHLGALKATSQEISSCFDSVHLTYLDKDSNLLQILNLGSMEITSLPLDLSYLLDTPEHFFKVTSGMEVSIGKMASIGGSAARYTPWFNTAGSPETLYLRSLKRRLINRKPFEKVPEDQLAGRLFEHYLFDFIYNGGSILFLVEI